MTNEMIWIVDVPVATIWTNPEAPRPIDQEGISNPLKIRKWYERLNKTLRLELCDQNLVQSQLLFGEEVFVDKIEGEWAKIFAVQQSSKKDPRGYPGWVPLNQIKQLNSNQWHTDQQVIITSKKAKLTLNHHEWLELSFATILPMIRMTREYVEVQTSKGPGKIATEDIEVYSDLKPRIGIDLTKSGEAFMELPYFWGGMSSFGYDCSGFTYNMHKANGYTIPRDASDQAMNGEDVSLNQLQTGDLLFFAHDNGQGAIHHVGFYYGNGQMLHSPSTGKGIEIITIKGTKYERELCIAKRYYL
ncbi:NlpC/P60 family protein [Filobacillus milosensis]|uniref:NlpC/P60 family protein n=1 Tax=Filobacillus milosensis TaxID=94137 RepID=A0A4Y8IJT6_9BACI|nr:C40 family peptidase [Filobacillus milosensis]TFB21077.1 NlpC/P60 family protein [Filobacillus milosensis]